MSGETHKPAKDSRPTRGGQLKRDRIGFPKASHVVAQKIRQAILSERAPEGSPLLPVKDMAEDLGVASTTVREALRLLEAEWQTSA